MVEFVYFDRNCGAENVGMASDNVPSEWHSSRLSARYQLRMTQWLILRARPRSAKSARKILSTAPFVGAILPDLIRELELAGLGDAWRAIVPVHTSSSSCGLTKLEKRHGCYSTTWSARVASAAGAKDEQRPGDKSLWTAAPSMQKAATCRPANHQNQLNATL